MSTLNKKLIKLSNRHKLPILLSLLYELYIRAYRKYPFWRRCLRFPISPRKPKNLIFIVGAYNAGTTIIKKSIAAHPNIACLPIEGDLLTSEISNMEEGGWHRCLYGNKKSIRKYRDSIKINAEQLFKDWSPWIHEDKHFLEKSISNSIRMTQLRNAFPGCKFINVIRSPGGVVNGIKKRSKPTSNAQKQLNACVYPDSLLYCQWSYIYGLIKSDSNLEDTFNCNYEQFIATPKSSMISIFNFLELESVPVEFKFNTLSIGISKLNIRPLQTSSDIVDYVDPIILAREIERLKCD